jgi:hypothetical protein
MNHWVMAVLASLLLVLGSALYIQSSLRRDLMANNDAPGK